MSSTTRITGMYSGLDTDALIEEMLQANKVKVNNYERDKTKVEWQRETMLDLNKELLDLQNTADDLRDEASFKVYTAETTDSRVATATATKNALEGTYNISTKVLATATTFTSNPVSGNENIAKIKNRDGEYVRYTTSLEKTAFNVTLNGETKTIVFGEGEGIFDKDPVEIARIFQEKIDDAFGGNQILVNVSEASSRGYDISFSCSSKALQMPITVSTPSEEELKKLGTETDPYGSTLDLLNINSGATNIFDTSTTIASFLNTSATEIKFNVNGYEETISTQTTVSDFFKKINNAGIDISMKYDSLSDAIIMKRESTGAGREIEVSDSLGLFSALGLVKNENTYKSGRNAVVSITDPEGRTRENVELTTNSFTYEGVNFSLTKQDENALAALKILEDPTSSEAEKAEALERYNASGVEASITVAKDVETVFNNVMEFVDKYNTILGKLNELYNEKPNKNYDPLVDDERDELSETQQEKWDKLAKQGIMYRDSTLQSAISSMRSAVTSILSTNADIKSLFQIGITTTQYSATGYDNGKLIVDEEKLKEAINNNMDEVSALFTNKPDYITGTVLSDSAVIASGSSFKITVNGRQETITFDRDYDLSDANQQSELVRNINSILSNRFGEKNVIFAISSGRMVVTSQKGNSVTLNKGDGTDALSLMGIDDGALYDSNALGFSNKIYNVMDTVMKAISDKAGSNATLEDESTLGGRLKDLNSYISREQDRLERLEDRYYSQFSAMENALSQLESQSSYITSMLSGSGM